MYSDDKIIEGIIRGDVEAYRMLFHRYYVVVMRFIWKLLKDRESAEDVAQNIFLKIWQGRNCLDSKRSIKNLLFTMAKNESINILKSTGMLTVRLEAEAESMITRGGYRADEILDAVELDRQVAKCVDSLPPQCRTVFLMSRYRNMSNDEIARCLNISKRTVESHISKALKELRKSLN